MTISKPSNKDLFGDLLDEIKGFKYQITMKILLALKRLGRDQFDAKYENKKTKYENKKTFCRYCLKCFNSKKVLMEHKKVCLNINGKQRLELESGSITLKDYFK